MDIFVTSDYHFNHGNIIKYCNRVQFMNKIELNIIKNGTEKEQKALRISKASTKRMNDVLVQNHNERIKPDDKVYFVGDFCFRSGKEASYKKPAKYWESKLNGKVIHIEGNHDRNNGIKRALKSATLEYGKILFWLIHRPPQSPTDIPKGIDCVLCGHVHTAWKVRWCDKIPMINVGTDTNNFYPYKMREILNYYQRLTDISPLVQAVFNCVIPKKELYNDK